MLRLPLIFQDGMVVQRRKAVCVWGEADCGQVSVTLGGAAALAQVRDGRWKAYLPPMEGATNLTMTVAAGEEQIHIRDVAAGEVWIAGGQSNMEFLLKCDAQREAAYRQSLPDIRCFEVPKISFAGQENHYKMSDSGFWRKAVGEQMADFPAVGFYFACRLGEALQTPVGIINCTWGGTSASCWVSPEYLTGELQFYLDNARRVQAAVDYDRALPGYIRMQQDILARDIDMGKPNLAPLEPLLDAAARERLMTMNNWPFSPFRPCGLYQWMVTTILGYSVSGVIWYQGESDEYASDHYGRAMEAVVRCWRDGWGEALPFLMVQLAGFEVMAEYLDFRTIRRAQEQLARTCPGVYLVTAMDVGMRYDIHPKQKRPVGIRLANQALDKVYHRHIPADSPTLERAKRQGDTILLKFKHCGAGLELRGQSMATLDVTADGQAVNTFAAELLEDGIRLTAPAFARADRVQVDFCQRPYCELTVYSAADLPVLPFSVCV